MIKFELNSTGYYKILNSDQWYLPFVLGYREVKTFNAAHSDFFSTQTWSMRFWISTSPGGRSITELPNPNWAYIDPLKNPVKFGIYDIVIQPKPQNTDAVWLWPYPSGQPLFLNVLNRANTPNGFYMTTESYNV